MSILQRLDHKKAANAITILNINGRNLHILSTIAAILIGNTQ